MGIVSVNSGSLQASINAGFSYVFGSTSGVSAAVDVNNSVGVGAGAGSHHVLRGRDVYNSNLGEAWLTIEGKKRRIFELREISAELENRKEDIQIINDVMTKHKVVACNGSGSFRIYTGVPEYAQILRNFIDNHINIYFEITFEINDPESSNGRRCITLKDVCVDKTILGRLSTDNGILEEDMSMTFDEYEITDDFKSYM